MRILRVDRDLCISCRSLASKRHLPRSVVPDTYHAVGDASDCQEANTAVGFRVPPLDESLPCLVLKLEIHWQPVAASGNRQVRRNMIRTARRSLAKARPWTDIRYEDSRIDAVSTENLILSTRQGAKTQ